MITIEVKCNTPTVDPDFGDLKITVDCATNDAHDKTYVYNAFSDLRNQWLTETGPELKEGAYHFTLTLDRAKVVTYYNENAGTGKTHTDTDPNTVLSWSWTWTQGEGDTWSWVLDNGKDEVTIPVKCTTGGGGGGGGGSVTRDYTLNYETNGGKAIPSETKTSSWTKAYADLPMPTRTGYRFDGWFSDKDLKNAVTGDVKVNQRSVTLYAGWTASTVPDLFNGDDHVSYIQGYEDGTVRPNANVTRAEVATILFRLLDDDVRTKALTETNSFGDVAPTFWANTAISTMTSLGVFQGRSADTFDPNAPITRGEFAAVCSRFDDSKVETTTTYTDVAGHWAASAIMRTAALGWVDGYEDGSFRPNNDITRAQVVTMVNRVLCRAPETADDLYTGMTTYPDCAPADWFYLAIQEASNSHDFERKSGSIYEKWTALTTAPDWSQFER